MNGKLLIRGLFKYLFGIILVVSLLFIPAGDLYYYNAWLFIGLLFIPMLVLGIILFFKNPKLLERRLDAKEKENEQRIVILISGLMFISGFVIAGLNYKYKWIELPNIVVIISSIVFLIDYILYGVVLYENSYLSRSIKVENKQELVDSGLYRIVRHPMYSITIILFFMIPLILNSLISFFVFLVYPILIIIRINNEEKVLINNLSGYKDYMKKVKYRLIPFLW